LEHGSEPGWACLRELTGEDEESVGATDSDAAIALLDRLLVDVPGASMRPGDAVELTIPDRDRLLAAVQLADLGTRIESTVRCVGCAQPFEIDFQLDALMESVRREAPQGVAVRETGGAFRLPDGRRFRLPRGSDERAVGSLPPEGAEQALVARCMIEGSAGDDPRAIVEAMRAVGPLLDVDVGASCAECGHAQTVRFDLQHYLLSELIDQRRQRAFEIHQIAMAYRWSLHEILSLARARRRIHADLIDREGARR
jgi:hypothetical protein